jgi:hypothetical protein
MYDQDEHFGMPESAIRAALESHEGILRDGCYIPTKTEVATMEPKRLRRILLGWIFESPAELIPTDAMVGEVVAILEGRPDAKEIVDLIREVGAFFE